MNRLIRREVGMRLREARKAARYTQQDVARDFLCTRQKVSAWETGKAMPTLLECRELAVLYGVSLDYLAFGIRTVPASLVRILDGARGKPEHPPESSTCDP
jgi:transcriptional regulator with XRE-family HTH domain